MKNLLKSTLYISVFALAGILFQISCSNSDQNLSTNSNPVGKIIYLKQVSTTSPGGGTSTNISLCTCNYDGSNETPINVLLPAGVQIATGYLESNVKISPDGQKIFFVTENSAGYKSIYSSDISGNNAAEVRALNAEGTIELGGAY